MDSRDNGLSTTLDSVLTVFNSSGATVLGSNDNGYDFEGFAIPAISTADASVVAAILALARALGMDVVAEGIETVEQRNALVALGCEYGQGFLLGRPAPMAHWLAREPQVGKGDAG